jgi:hypothetical protein
VRELESAAIIVEELLQSRIRIAIRSFVGGLNHRFHGAACGSGRKERPGRHTPRLLQ